MSDTQLSLEDAIAAGQEGQVRAEAHVDDEWAADALEAIAELCATRETFTADDVWGTGLVERRQENRALGPMLKKAQKLGWCEPTSEFTRSAQVNCHGMPRRIWRSCVA